MEVTSANFKELLPKIEEDINKATFLGIDCEFSGLNVVSEINAYDTPKQYYEKVRKNSRDFLVIQYGISAFRFDESSDSFKQQTYNFYIFRRPINGNIPDQRFLCQTSSINFLTTQGFDFNKLFKSGISYLNISEEGEYQKKLLEKQKYRSSQLSAPQSCQDLIPIPEENQAFIDDIFGQIDKFLGGDTEELELPKCNAFVRRLIYQTAGQKYTNKIVLQTRQMKNKDRILVATKFKNRAEQEELERQVCEQEMTALDDFIGFTKVLRILVDSGKLIVGHNVCLDFLHTIDKFLTPLPEDYEEFKECAHALFKSVLDTKFLSRSEEFQELIQSSILKDVLESVSKEPFELPTVDIEKDGQGYYLGDPKEHEAGYDAYITGVCMISMWKFLGKKKGLSDREIFSNFKLLEPYINKLHLMILRDNQYINLAGAEPNPSRDHVFYVTFPKEWKLSNLIELFSPFGSVYVAWINESSAYVELSKRNQSSVALSTLSQSDTYTIMPFAQRQLQLKGLQDTSHNLFNFGHKRKRELEPIPQSYGKKMKSDNLGIGRSTLDSILEVEGELTPKSSNKGAASKTNLKTFVESDLWE